MAKFISETSPDGKKLTIAVQGRFDYHAHQSFRQCYQGIEPLPDTIVIDMTATDYLDSSALGMLLLLRNDLGQQVAISIENTSPAVKKILNIANFQHLFSIEP